jgi:GNAT superfamily N-acetyltransferase
LYTEEDLDRYATADARASPTTSGDWCGQKPQQRNRPDPVPVTLLGQLAVDCHDQGQGHARSLLLFALRTALEASVLIGSTGIITHPLDDSVRAFYKRWGFQDLPFDPRRAMIVRMADLRASFGAAE